MREDFNRFWTYSSPKWASKFLLDWCARANRSGIEPMKRMAKMIERHEPLLLNWFETRRHSSGIVEGFNNKAKLTMRKSYGFKEVETISTALYHQLGDLPEPTRTHTFFRRVCEKGSVRKGFKIISTELWRRNMQNYLNSCPYDHLFTRFF